MFLKKIFLIALYLLGTYGIASEARDNTSSYVKSSNPFQRLGKRIQAKTSSPEEYCHKLAQSCDRQDFYDEFLTKCANQNYGEHYLTICQGKYDAVIVRHQAQQKQFGETYNEDYEFTKTNKNPKKQPKYLTQSLQTIKKICLDHYNQFKSRLDENKLKLAARWNVEREKYNFESWFKSMFKQTKGSDGELGYNTTFAMTCFRKIANLEYVSNLMNWNDFINELEDVRTYRFKKIMDNTKSPMGQTGANRKKQNSREKQNVQGKIPTHTDDQGRRYTLNPQKNRWEYTDKKGNKFYFDPDADKLIPIGNQAEKKNPTQQASSRKNTVQAQPDPVQQPRSRSNTPQQKKNSKSQEGKTYDREGREFTFNFQTNRWEHTDPNTKLTSYWSSDGRLIPLPPPGLEKTLKNSGKFGTANVDWDKEEPELLLPTEPAELIKESNTPQQQTRSRANSAQQSPSRSNTPQPQVIEQKESELDLSPVEANGPKQNKKNVGHFLTQSIANRRKQMREDADDNEETDEP